ncbi:MAG: acyl-CoA thioesterase [Actinoallomurus sp.]
MIQPALDTGHVAEPRKHVHEFHVRFSDIDSLGHVNNCRYLTYLEDARVAMFFTDPEREGRRPLRGLVVARHEIDYRQPLLLRPDPVRVETRVTEIRAASFGLAYEVRDDEHVYAQATSVIVGYDLKAARTRRFDERERVFLQQYAA